MLRVKNQLYKYSAAFRWKRVWMMIPAVSDGFDDRWAGVGFVVAATLFVGPFGVRVMYLFQLSIRFPSRKSSLLVVPSLLL